MKAESKVDRLERKVDAMSKALNLVLFEEPETLTADEVKELKEAMGDYLHSRKEKFISLDEL